MENSLSREEALRSMTLWAAKASFEENEKGSLEPGKWADFVVLDTDLMTASPEEILNATVVATYIAGEKSTLRTQLLSMKYILFRIRSMT